MATTIPGAFTTFKSRLEITDLQTQTVSARQKNVRDAVVAKMTVLDSFLTGSYSRSTMISPLAKADIDIFVVLDPKYFEQSGQAALLDKVKRALRATYPKTPEISRNGQAVTITFTDFKVDVVPSFNRNGGGFLMPSTTAPNGSKPTRSSTSRFPVKRTQPTTATSCLSSRCSRLGIGRSMGISAPST